MPAPLDVPNAAVVTTIADKCRRCYNCVRSCPAKAIRVQNGQAYVIQERCIGCGNCLRVCAQQAKQVQTANPAVSALLQGEEPVVAILAPSYAGTSTTVSPGQFRAAVKQLGFSHVMEVAFGAEMVAQEYARLLKRAPQGPLISTPCPALVSYVEKYLPDLVQYLAPVVSPMVAMGRAVKERLVPGAKVVFIGPCVAKKVEVLDPHVAGAVDAAMTFPELAELWRVQGIEPAALEPIAPDGPLPEFGALFPVSGGLLKAACIQADLMHDEIVVVEGADRVLAALNALSVGEFQGGFLDALMCEGCIAGPAYDDKLSPLVRKSLVTAAVRELQRKRPPLARSLKQVSVVEVKREFQPGTITLPMPTEDEIRQILLRTNKTIPEQELNCGACGYSTCRDKAIAVYQGLAEPEMCLPYLIDQLQVNLEQLTRSREEIQKARELALRAQQLAEMGRLAAQTAKQISNPLSNLVVYSQLLRDTLDEEDPRREDVANIIAEALHCREVMANLQGFAREREPQWQETRLEPIVEAALEEVRARAEAAGITLSVELAADIPELVADAAQLSQVLVNLLTNSIEAMDESGQITVTARFLAAEGQLELVVSDAGCGVPAELLPRVFQPFVTTKWGDRAAGFGLAVAHGIIHSHHGDIQMDSKPGRGTTVTIHLPLHQAQPPRGAVRVLVVDDDPDFLEQHRLRLASVGFEVIAAERSDEALEIAAREIPDAFVLDLMMEKADSGARLARALRRDPRFRRAPIIMLTSVVQATGFEFDRNPEAVLEWMKADAWFDKPAPMAELTATLRRLLAANQQESPEEAEPLPRSAGVSPASP
ncbi:MAG: [Fe-Fe] hydrogenase large subunit C-terminal domain-containing protein [Armatimonadia bacterium]